MNSVGFIRRGKVTESVSDIISATGNSIVSKDYVTFALSNISSTSLIPIEYIIIESVSPTFFAPIPPVLEGFQVSVGESVLVINCTNSSNNGVWKNVSGVMVHQNPSNNSLNQIGTMFLITKGVLQQGTLWTKTSSTPHLYKREIGFLQDRFLEENIGGSLNVMTPQIIDTNPFPIYSDAISGYYNMVILNPNASNFYLLLSSTPNNGKVQLFNNAVVGSGNVAIVSVADNLQLPAEPLTNHKLYIEEQGFVVLVRRSTLWFIEYAQAIEIKA